MVGVAVGVEASGGITVTVGLGSGVGVLDRSTTAGSAAATTAGAPSSPDATPGTLLAGGVVTRVDAGLAGGRTVDVEDAVEYRG
ncbi:MAG: hypothetical protein HYX94_06965 [Chloroflexi bacterium]|nr:hypothetical protein [Chloroflexota bacterium]